MRTLARVDADMDGEGGALDEGFAAAAKVAAEGTLLTVDASVPVGCTRQRDAEKRRGTRLAPSPDGA
jgi:hypothetical protein